MIPIHMLTGTYRVIDPWFARDRCPIELDLGCGKGTFSADLAARFPGRLVLASDVMLGRLRKLRNKLQHRGLNNVELLRTNSRDLVGYQLPDACVNRLHLLCPDPWPKARHRHRRVITTDFMTRVARVLAPGGVFHFASDHAPYLHCLERILPALPCFHAAPDAIADIADLQTDFERVWRRDGRHVPHLAYVRAAD